MGYSTWNLSGVFFQKHQQRSEGVRKAFQWIPIQIQVVGNS